MILVAGALTLPLAFDDHMADAKKKKSYNRNIVAVKRLKKKPKSKQKAVMAEVQVLAV